MMYIGTETLLWSIGAISCDAPSTEIWKQCDVHGEYDNVTQAAYNFSLEVIFLCRLRALVLATLLAVMLRGWVEIVGGGGFFWNF